VSGFRPRLDILPPAQRQLWDQLQPARNLGFVLYGGTAIALRLGHRVSVDFDFFSDSSLDRNSIKVRFPFLGQASVLQDDRQSLTFLIPSFDRKQSDVKLSFFGLIRFGRIGTPDLTTDEVAQLASLDDLLATKLKVVLQRAEAKDYQDISAMLAEGVQLARGLAGARALYGVDFQPSEALKALTYFEDGDLNSVASTDRAQLTTASKAVRSLPDVQILSYDLADR
jgi:hypothetical protein